MQENEHEEPYLTIYLSAMSPAQNEIDDYIETKLGHEVIAAEPAAPNTPVSIGKLEQLTEDCSYAIIVMQGATGGTREKQLHEIAYCQGTFGYQNVLVLREAAAPEFLNLTGVMYETFTGENIKATFPRIRAEIVAALERFMSEEEVDED
ncbi:MAG: TIR domain-containing protein [Spirochaetota bacterium]